MYKFQWGEHSATAKCRCRNASWAKSRIGSLGVKIIKIGSETVWKFFLFLRNRIRSSLILKLKTKTCFTTVNLLCVDRSPNSITQFQFQRGSEKDYPQKFVP